MTTVIGDPKTAAIRRAARFARGDKAIYLRDARADFNVEDDPPQFVVEWLGGWPDSAAAADDIDEFRAERPND